MMNDENRPIWERQNDEPSHWFARFQKWLLLGAERRALQVYREDVARRGAKWRGDSGLPRSWRLAMVKYEWLKRAAEFDAEQNQKLVVLWEKRQEEWREKEFQIADKLFAKAQDMLLYPLQTTRHENQVSADGKTINNITVYEPTRWGMGNIGQLAEVASKLARLASAMETDRGILDLGDLQDDKLATLLKERIDALKRRHAESRKVSGDGGTPDTNAGVGEGTTS